MYIVANPSKKEVVISDLKLVIPPHQSRDLHSLDLPISPEKSKDLETSKRKGYIKVIKQDVILTVGQVMGPPPELPTQQIIIHEKEVVDKEYMAQTIRDEIQKSFSNQKSEQFPVQNNDLLNEIIKKLDNILNKNQKEDGPEEEIDEKILTKIHAKVVDKIVKDVEISSLEYDQKNIKDISVSKNISELEDMI
jgi:hypothetical protein